MRELRVGLRARLVLARKAAGWQQHNEAMIDDLNHNRGCPTPTGLLIPDDHVVPRKFKLLLTINNNFRVPWQPVGHLIKSIGVFVCLANCFQIHWLLKTLVLTCIYPCILLFIRPRDI
jgi:hypothetical protein